MTDIDPWPQYTCSYDQQHCQNFFPAPWEPLALRWRRRRHHSPNMSKKAKAPAPYSKLEVGASAVSPFTEPAPHDQALALEKVAAPAAPAPAQLDDEEKKEGEGGLQHITRAALPAAAPVAAAAAQGSLFKHFKLEQQTLGTHN